jgi:thiol-disulfide isomerase/thioredoxin
MIERFIISLLLILLSTGLVYAFRFRHMERASRVVSAGSTGEGHPALLYFRSDSCAPCVTQSKYLNVLQEELGGGLNIQKIDADVDREKADKYGIFTLPTTLIVNEYGEVKHINYGLAPPSKLAQQIESIL